MNKMNHMKQFDEYLNQKGYRFSNARNVVAQTFFKLSEHVDIEALYKKVREKDANVGIATVYRTLNLLVESGLVVKRNFETGATTYEKIDGEHHDHLICVGCKTVVEFHNQKIEDLQTKVAAQYGYVLKSHKMELYGECSKCLAKKN